MKATLAITVFNEEKSINILLSSILKQTKLPDQIVIVDGGSTDKTVQNIQQAVKQHQYFRRILKLVITKRASRPKGRNISIKKAQNEVIAITDAGCELDSRWFERIISPLTNEDIDVVAGYYGYKTKTIFEKCLAPYVLIMPDRLNPQKFLPSSRSMAIKKSVWRDVGGFPQEYPLNEDYVFNLKLKKMGKNFFFVKDAIVYWLPRENIKKSFLMFYYFAKGDAQARIFRPKVLWLFVRYFFGIAFLIYFLILNSYVILNILYLAFFLYLLWAVFKNYKYVKKWQAIFILPILQITSDIAVLSGTSSGLLKNIWDTQKKQ